MPSRYPSTLFHFTDKKGLLGILKNNFRISYAKEYIRGPTEEAKFGAPMVSFCDLRLSELMAHMATYKKYGIGMSKTWANSNGLNTVNYINAHSDLADNLIRSVRHLFEVYQEIDGAADSQKKLAFGQAYMEILNLYRFTKNYEGFNSKLNDPNYRFADEREWRYVPRRDSNLWPFVPVDRIDTPAKKKSANLAFESTFLYFEPNDIRYIIVEREDERDEIIDRVFNAKGERYGGIESLRLASRILTAEQIHNDV